MKKIFLLSALALLFTLGAQAQLSHIDDLFDKYEEVEGVTTIKIAKPMFKMLNNLKIDDDDLDKIRPLISKINSIHIIIFEPQHNTGANAGTALNRANVKNEIYSAVKGLHFEELMSVNSHGSKIKFLTESTSPNADVINKLLLSINSNDTNMLMLLDGKISMSELSKLVNDNDK